MLKAIDLKKQYKPKNGQIVNALDGVSVDFSETGMVFILGKSGSGKSTLLNVLGGLDKYDSGEVIVKGKSSKDFSQADFDSYRNTFIGFIFQEYNILQEFSVEKNIGLALELQGKKADKEAINALIEQVDLKGYGKRKPNTLSGGQKQRVAIARALVKNPEIIMADEPTGALDSKTGAQVLDTLKKLSKEKLVIVVSHDREFAEYYADRIIELKDGKIISDQTKHKIEPKVSNGLEIVDDKVLTIKKGTKLDSNKIEEINKFLQSQDDDVIISVDNNANKEFKKFARIDDDGKKESFKETATADIKTKDYDGDVKLIRSKLPTKDSIKMGASGLKTKRFRLVITVLLSAAAFGMFGLADTMGSYDKVKNTVQSIEDSKIDYALFSKQRIVYDGKEQIWGTSQNNLTIEDVTYLNDTLGMNFTPVYTIGDYNDSFSENIKNTNDLNEDRIYTTSFSGMVDSKSGLINEYGTFICGNEPNGLNEMVITKYCAESFVKGGYKDYRTGTETKINSYNDLLNKKISVSGREFTISGIIDTNLDLNRYESLKTDKYDVSIMFLLNELEQIKNRSSHTLCFLKEGFYDKYIKANNIFINSFNIEYEETDGDNTNNYYVNKIGNYTQNMPNVYFFKKDKNNLADDEVIHTTVNTFTELKIDLNETKVRLFDLIGSTNKIDLLWNGSFMNKYPSLYQYINMSGYGIEPIITYYAKCNEYLDIDDSIVAWSGDDYNFNEGIMNTGLDSDTVKNEFESFIEVSRNIYTLRDIKNYLLNTPEYSSIYASEYDRRKDEEPGLDEFDYLRRVFSSVMYNDKSLSEITDNERILFDAMVKSALDAYSDYISEKTITVYAGSPFKEKPKEYKVVGFYLDQNGNNWSSNLINNYLHDKLSVFSSGGFNYVISKLDYHNDSLVKKIVKFNYENKGETDQDGFRVEAEYKLNNNVMNMVNNVNEFIETGAKVFLYVGIGFAVFASLLLLNFITISISYKKREIGVLRAIGARGMDVFKIFFWESFIIALINFVLAFIALIIACFFLNRMFRNDYGFLITLLHVGIRQVILMFIVSLAVAFISSSIPVSLIARKKPIDAIRSAE